MTKPEVQKANKIDQQKMFTNCTALFNYREIINLVYQFTKQFRILWDKVELRT